MITWLLLLSLFRISTQDGEENGVLRCGPQNVTLSSDDQTLLLTWGDGPSCSEVRDGLVYELEVLVADKPEHTDEVAVTPAQMGSTHSWKWTSYLPLQCASHSVRLRSQYNNQSSPWMQKTLPGIQEQDIRIFPEDQIREVNSTVTFCCIVPKGKSFSRMYLKRYEGTIINTKKISEHVHTLTVHLDQESENWSDVICNTTTGNSSGVCFHAGYPPGESDLQCETRDLDSIDCVWNVGKKTNEYPLIARKYHLEGRLCNDVKSGKCSQKLPVEAGERNWTLTVENPLGKLELHDTADLTRRVHMLAPQDVVASTVNARNLSLKWSWTVQKYSHLNLTCQVDVRDREANATTENFGVGLTAAVINSLRPFWDYNVRVRCGTAQHFWKWGDWSPSVTIRTKRDVPDALDVWMKVKDDRTVITWKKPLASQSHGDILGYEVAWAKTKEKNQPNKTEVPSSNYSLALQLDPSEDYTIMVTARNINGSSLPSTITVPRRNPVSDKPKVNTSWINGSNGGFTLSWSHSPDATCGYIVDWCPAFGDCTVEWLKVPPNRTNARILSENFKDGLRYLLSISACTEGAPMLLHRREGYIRETKIEGELFKLHVDPKVSDVEVSWDPIPLEKQTAAIQGYVLYYYDSGSIFNMSTENPEATRLTAKNLNISTYTFTLTAQTALGLCGNSSTSITLNPSADNLIMLILISLVAVFIVLSTITILCYKHWA
ncbi:leukemia inhibitory factor receptor-like isoform X1 [Archocentrus centrarchus]|uniref:leukemia inhibitory factor receptor-like isoform X1 n=2 Tax=Archocentrus centrarchus TaxID=63155 RepID=UPI0011EA2996|nr:leukemia inhibitory factor receptor-like isoform X1 [Archocentrus centrarchus]XP_030598761.1 leukemia inhibitory factor receptor-like isoform X1 [Archocentrus centrarchus]